MAREKTEIGIIVMAKDTAAAVLKGIGVAASGTSKAVQSMAKAATGALKSVGGAVIVLNQGLGLAKKAFKAFEFVVGDTVKSALNFRDAHDKSAQTILKLGKNLEQVRARAGDALIPVLEGIANAMNPILKSWQSWLIANQKIIGTKILEWGMKVGTILINGVATGAIAVARAWNGWSMVIDVVKLGINKFFMLVTAGMSGLLSSLGKVAGAFGDNPISKALQGIGEDLNGLSDEFDRSGNDASASLAQTTQALDAQERKINDLKDRALVGLGQVGVSVQKAIQTATIGTTHTLEEQGIIAQRNAERAALSKKLQERIDAGLISQALSNETLKQDAIAKTAQIQQDNAQKTAEIVTAVAATIGQALFDAMEAAISGAKSAKEAFLDMAKVVLKAILAQVASIIIAKIAEAAANAIAAHSGIPFVGVAIGLGAAAAAAAAILSFKKFAKGGEVSGGQAGKDSVPALLMPGERVLTVEQNRLFKKFMGNPDAVNASTGGVVRMAKGGEVSRGMAGGGELHVHLTPQLETIAPPSQAETERYIMKNVRRAMEKLSKDGQLQLAR